MKPLAITAAPVKKAIQVRAPQARAFEVFTARFGSWWPKNHHIGKVEAKDFVIEPRVGGLWYELGVDGSRCPWGEVLTWEPPARIVLAWRLNSKFAYDETVASEVEVRFVAESSDTTRVELEHRITAADAEALRKSVDSAEGWGILLKIFADAAKSDHQPGKR